MKKKKMDANEYLKVIKGIKRVGREMNMSAEIIDCAMFNYDRRLGDVELVIKKEKK